MTDQEVLSKKIEGCKWVLHNQEIRNPEKMEKYIARLEFLLKKVTDKEELNPMDRQFVDELKDKVSEKEEQKKEFQKYEPLFEELKKVNKNLKILIDLFRVKGAPPSQGFKEERDKEGNLPF